MKLLERDYPRLRIEPICGDYLSLEALPELEFSTRRVGFFPGSSIGNLEPLDASAFIAQVRQLLGKNAALVLGVDLKKDPQKLHAAYNDAAGLTAAFSLNLLRRMNRELKANFDLEGFKHEAFYNSIKGRIEIYLCSLRKQSVVVANSLFSFTAGERIHTEYSYKYDLDDLKTLAQAGGFTVKQTWIDKSQLFAVSYLST